MTWAAGASRRKKLALAAVRKQPAQNLTLKKTEDRRAENIWKSNPGAAVGGRIAKVSTVDPWGRRRPRAAPKPGPIQRKVPWVTCQTQNAPFPLKPHDLRKGPQNRPKGRGTKKKKKDHRRRWRFTEKSQTVEGKRKKFPKLRGVVHSGACRVLFFRWRISTQR